MKTILSITVLLALLNSMVHAQLIGVDNGTQSGGDVHANVPVKKTSKPNDDLAQLREVNANGFIVTLHGCALSPISSDPAYDAYLAQRTNNPASLNYINTSSSNTNGQTVLSVDNLIRRGTPGQMLARFPVTIRSATGGKIRLSDWATYFRLDGVPGFAVLSNYQQTFNSYDNGAVGWNNGQKIVSGSADQEVDVIQLAGGMVYLFGDTQEKYNSARAAFDPVIPGNPVYGGVVHRPSGTVYADPTMSQAFLIMITPGQTQGTMTATVHPAGSYTGNLTIQAVTGLQNNPGANNWQTVGTVGAGNTFQLATGNGQSGYYRLVK